MLKRAIAREIYRSLTQHVEVPAYADLRPARQAKNLTLTAVANHFGVWPAHISTLERGLRRDDNLAQHTGPGSRPHNLQVPPSRPTRRRAGAVKMQRPTGRTILTAPSTGTPSNPAEPFTTDRSNIDRRVPLALRQAQGHQQNDHRCQPLDEHQLSRGPGV